MTTPEAVRRDVDLWANSDLKVQLIVFYGNNPGTVETVEGLARRLGVHVDALRSPVRDQVRLGILRERQAGSQTVLFYDAARALQLRSDLEDEFRRREGST